MKAISKTQVIQLMDAINRDGLGNSQYNIDDVYSERNSIELYGGEYNIILQAGAYCAIWVEDPLECSDIPFVSRFINGNLDKDNFELIFNGQYGAIFIICLDLL